jgi:hypothetical protein
MFFIKKPISHRHVLGRPSESARARANELAGNAKVTELDHALAREEDVGGLDVPVDDFLGMQTRKALQDLSSGVGVGMSSHPITAGNKTGVR